MTRVTYIHYPDTTLTFDLKVNFFDNSSCSTHNFCLLWHQHTILSTWVYQHERFMCWPLTSRSNLLGFWHGLCLGHISCTWVHHHKMMCHIHSWPLHDLDLWLQYQNYICFWTRSFLDWCRHTKFSTWVLHHETTCVQSYPVYDFDLWLTCTCRWRGYP